MERDGMGWHGWNGMGRGERQSSNLLAHDGGVAWNKKEVVRPRERVQVPSPCQLLPPAIFVTLNQSPSNPVTSVILCIPHTPGWVRGAWRCSN